MRSVVLLALVASLALSGCATKRYGRMTGVSETEASLMTCREISMEQAKVEAFRYQIATGAKIDWRSVAGFLGDYGIGNAMEKNEAERTATARMMQLQRLWVDKRCQADPSNLPSR